MTRISRRDFVRLGTAGAVAVPLVLDPPRTHAATIDVMRRAVKAGANMIITSGPTFYSRADRPMPPVGRGRGAAATPPADPVFVAKNEFIVGYATPSVNDPAVDVVISGEQQEVDGGFDNPEYVLDAAALGIPKGWIMLGHAVSEEAGMLEMAQWIGRFVTEVPVRLIKAGEPFWAPK